MCLTSAPLADDRLAKTRSKCAGTSRRAAHGARVSTDRKRLGQVSRVKLHVVWPASA